MRQTWLAIFAVYAALLAGCFSPVSEQPAIPDAGGCPAGLDCGGGLLPDAGCPIGQVCPACDAGLVLVEGACVSPTDAGPLDAGHPDAGPGDAGPGDAGSPDSGPADSGVPDSGPGAACLSGTLSDAESMGPVSGAAVIGTDINGVPIPGASTTSAADGSFQLCPPAGVVFTTQITAAGYPTTYFESLSLGTMAEPLGSLPLISTEVLGALGGFLPGGFDSSDAAMLVPVRSLSGNCSVAGWSISAGFPDGGTLPDGGGLPYQIAYLAASGLPSGTATSTSTEGAAILYNIDPTLTGQVAVVATNGSAGSCAPDNAALGLTGQVEVGGGAISIAPIVLP
jgi:hypothetical protein